MIVFDSNIIIDYFNGHEEAKHEIFQHPERAISTVTWIEVMTGAFDPDYRDFTAKILEDHFVEIALSRDIAIISARLRREHRLKLPDAIIWATALQQKTLLITRNSKDFPKKDRTIRIPYVLRNR